MVAAMTETWWVDALIVAGAVVAALSTIWIKIIGPLFHFGSVASDALPVLVTIADEFRPGGTGSSLRESVDRIEAAAGDAAKQAGVAFESVIRVEEMLGDHIATEDSKLDEIRTIARKAHDAAEALRIETAQIAADVAEKLKERSAVQDQILAQVTTAGAVDAGGPEHAG